MKPVPSPTAANAEDTERRPMAPQVNPARLIVTLGLAGALAGLLLVTVHGWTEPRIIAHREAALRAAVAEVLADPASTETFYIIDGRAHRKAPEGIAEASLERVFRGFDAEGDTVGYAIVSAEPGFQDFIRVIFGYDAATGRVLGMRVLESKETPGLGDKIEKDLAWVALFEGAEAPLSAVKGGRGTGASGEIDTITGATISSAAVVRIIQNAIDRIEPILEAIDRSPPPEGGDS